MFKAFALGADACYSARAMMMALGCIQALECNKNNCPTGVATQDPELVKGLVSEDKAKRVTSFHKETIHSFIELLAAAGLKKHTDVNRSLIYRRVSVTQSERYDQIFPYVKTGAFLSMETCPGNYRVYLEAARAETFNAVFEGV
jgi:hypothetical protein